MNNNFTFNFVDNPDKEEEPKIEIEKIEEKLPEKELKDKKKNQFKERINTKKLLNYAIGFIVIIVVGFTLGNNVTIPDTAIPNVNDNSNKSNESLGEISTFLNNNNYSFDIEITVIEDSITKIYKLSGTNKEGIISGTSMLDDNIIEYTYENKKYFVMEDDEKKEITIDTIYQGTNYKYSDIEIIEKYISYGILESSSSVLNNYTKNYSVRLDKILYTFMGDETISIIINNNEKEYNIEVDYSNLLKFTNEKISSYIVKQKYVLIDDSA